MRVESTLLPTFTLEDSRKAISSSLERAWGLARYARLVKGVQIVDVSSDADYQKDFVFFFKVRRNREWREAYFGELERVKCCTPVFPSVLSALFAETGRIEASFASKLVSVVDPRMPILDSIVLSYLGLEIKGISAEERMRSALNVYDDVCSWYQRYMKSRSCAESIELFDSILPEYAWISDVKKIDFLLWSSR